MCFIISVWRLSWSAHSSNPTNRSTSTSWPPRTSKPSSARSRSLQSYPANKTSNQSTKSPSNSPTSTRASYKTRKNKESLRISWLIRIYTLIRGFIRWRWLSIWLLCWVGCIRCSRWGGSWLRRICIDCGREERNNIERYRSSGYLIELVSIFYRSLFGF